MKAFELFVWLTNIALGFSGGAVVLATLSIFNWLRSSERRHGKAARVAINLVKVLVFGLSILSLLTIIVFHRFTPNDSLVPLVWLPCFAFALWIGRRHFQMF